MKHDGMRFDLPLPPAVPTRNPYGVGSNWPCGALTWRWTNRDQLDFPALSAQPTDLACDFNFHIIFVDMKVAVLLILYLYLVFDGVF